MKLRHLILCLCSCFAAVHGVEPTPAKNAAVLTPQQAQYPENIVMLRTDAAGREGLCTPIARYKDAEGRIVDLVGAIHLADARYYRGLNRIFGRYDKVLYEMVDGEDLPEVVRLERKVQAGTATPEEVERLKRYNAARKSGMGVGMLSAYYSHMASAMGLALQTELVDYGRENLVYADMSSSEFAAAMAERGETWFTLVLDSLRDGSGKRISLFSSVTPDGLKRMLCEQLVGSSKGSHSEGRAIIIARNERCFEVLDRLLAQDFTARRMAIFYGAMHLRDMHARLLQRGFTLQGVQWVTAIRL